MLLVFIVTGCFTSFDFPFWNLQIPGTLTCPMGWNLQYFGHIAAAHYTHYATEYICMDNDLEDLVGGSANANGHLFHLTRTRCGAMPCPPFEDGRTLTCVVCSKGF